jgi:hypothetical protein
MGNRGTTNAMLSLAVGTFAPDGQPGAVGYPVGEVGKTGRRIDLAGCVSTRCHAQRAVKPPATATCRYGRELIRLVALLGERSLSPPLNPQELMVFVDHRTAEPLSSSVRHSTTEAPSDSQLSCRAT